MAKRVLSIRRFRSLAAISNLWFSSPAARSGKSSGGSVCRAKRECPEVMRQPLLLDVALDLDLGAVGQLAHDVVQDVGGHRHGARLRHVGRRLLLHLALEVGGLELQGIARRLEQHIRQNGDGRAPLDHARDVTECPHQLTALNHQLHALASPRRMICRVRLGASRTRRAMHREIVRQSEKPLERIGRFAGSVKVDRDAVLCKGRPWPPPGHFRRWRSPNDVQERRRSTLLPATDACTGRRNSLCPLTPIKTADAAVIAGCGAECAG